VVDDSLLCDVFSHNSRIFWRRTQDGQDAFDKLNAGWLLIVICDIEMPRLDGYALWKLKKAQEKFECLLLCCHRVLEKERQIAFEKRDKSTYLSKPYNEQICYQKFNFVIL